MRKYIRQYEFPVPSTESVTDASFMVHGKNAVIHFDYYRDGHAWRSGIRFKEVFSTRTRSERCCTSQHIKSFDALIEYVDSDWVSMQRSEISEMYREQFSPKHYSIYLDSVGCFEILAVKFEVIPEEAGSWVDINRVRIPN